MNCKTGAHILKHVLNRFRVVPIEWYSINFIALYLSEVALGPAISFKLTSQSNADTHMVSLIQT